MKKFCVRAGLFILFLALSIPVGISILAIKESFGIDIFKSTGYHAFEACLAKETDKAAQDINTSLQTKNPR